MTTIAHFKYGPERPEGIILGLQTLAILGVIEREALMNLLGMSRPGFFKWIKILEKFGVKFKKTRIEEDGVLKTIEYSIIDYGVFRKECFTNGTTKEN